MKVAVGRVKDPWLILNVKKGSSKKEVKLAFQKAAMKSHPDQGGSSEEFMAVQKAYASVRQAEQAVRRAEAAFTSANETRGERLNKDRAVYKRRLRSPKAWEFMDKWRYDPRTGTLEPDDEAFERHAKQRPSGQEAEHTRAALTSPAEDIGWIVFVVCGLILSAAYFVVSSLFQTVVETRREDVEERRKRAGIISLI